jgi:hypothetical protein
VKKFFSFMKSHLSIFSLSCCWGSIEEVLPVPITSRLFPALSCTNFRVSGLMLRSLIHFELILVQGDKHLSSFRFSQIDNSFSQQYLLKRLSFLHHMFWAPLSKIRWE